MNICKKLFLLFCCLGMWQFCSADVTQATLVERCPKVLSMDDIFPPGYEPGSVAYAVHMTKLFKQHNAPRIAYALGRPAILEDLLAQGENPNVCALGSSILEMSAVSGNLKEVQLLIKGGAHPDKPMTSGGNTPLMNALTLSHFEIALFLLEQGANPHHATDGGLTTLHELASAVVKPDSKELSLQLQVARQLIRSGVSVNAQVAIPKTTPLIHAVLQENKALISLFIENGADVNLVDKGGETALTYAQKRGYTEIIELLKKAGAKDLPPSID